MWSVGDRGDRQSGVTSGRWPLLLLGLDGTFPGTPWPHTPPCPTQRSWTDCQEWPQTSSLGSRHVASFLRSHQAASLILSPTTAALNSFGCQPSGVRVPPASSTQTAGVLLSIVGGTGQPPPQRIITSKI